MLCDLRVTGERVCLCRYKRVFCIGTKGITTLNPGSSEVTNQVNRFEQSHEPHPLSIINPSLPVAVQRICRHSTKLKDQQ